MRLKQALANYVKIGTLPKEPAIFFSKLELETSNKATTADFLDIIQLLDLQTKAGNIQYVATVLSYLSLQGTLKDLFFRHSIKFAINFNATELFRLLAQYSYEHLHLCTTSNVFGLNVQAEIPIRDMVAITNNNDFGRVVISLLSKVPTHPRSITVGNLVYQSDIKSFTEKMIINDNTSEIFQIKDIALELINKGMEKFKIEPSQDTLRFVALARYLGFKEPENPCELYQQTLPLLQIDQMQYNMLLIDLMSSLGKRIRNNCFTSTVISNTQKEIANLINSVPEAFRSQAITYLESCLDFPELKAAFKERAAEIASENLPKFSNTTEDQRHSIREYFFQMENLSNENKLYGSLTAISLFDQLVSQKTDSIREEGFLRSCNKLAIYVGQKIAKRNTFCFDMKDLVSNVFSQHMFSTSFSKNTAHLAGIIFDEFGAGFIFERILKSCSFKQEEAGLQNEDLMQL